MTITESPDCIKAAQRWFSYTFPSRMLTPTEKTSGHPSLQQSGKDYCPHQRIVFILCLNTLFIIPFSQSMSTIFYNLFHGILQLSAARIHFKTISFSRKTISRLQQTKQRWLSQTNTRSPSYIPAYQNSSHTSLRSASMAKKSLSLP